MKKIILFIFLGFFAQALAEENFETTFNEYARDFEMGFTDEENEPKFELKQKEEYINEGDEIIELTPLAPKKAGKTKSVKYKNTEKENIGKTELYKKDNFIIYSTGEIVKSDYMTEDFKTSLNADYKLNDFIKLKAGHEVKYVNPNANINSKKLFFNPSLNLGKNVSVDYTGKFNENGKNFEQEIGFKYKPAFLKNSASFGLTTGAVINDNEVQSKNFKFSTDLYLF